MMKYEYREFLFELDEFNNIHVYRKSDNEYLDMLDNYWDRMDKIEFIEKCESWARKRNLNQ